MIGAAMKPPRGCVKQARPGLAIGTRAEPFVSTKAIQIGGLVGPVQYPNHHLMVSIAWSQFMNDLTYSDADLCLARGWGAARTDGLVKAYVLRRVWHVRWSMITDPQTLSSQHKSVNRKQPFSPVYWNLHPLDFESIG